MYTASTDPDARPAHRPRQTPWRARLGVTLLLVTGLVTAGGVAPVAHAAGPLPTFSYVDEITKAEQLRYNPTGEFIFPSVFHAGEYLANPLGEWYLYYAPHDDPGGVSFMYADDLTGPWTEYAANPVVSNVWSPHYNVPHVSSPDAIWNEREGKVFLYFHGGNNRTRYATSSDGISFTYGGTALTNSMTGTSTTETSYGRVFRHPNPASADKYGMFFMQNTTANVRRIRLAESVDGRSWTVRQNFVIEPGSLDAGNVSGGNLWAWDGQLYVIYHASSKKTFARPIDQTLTQVGSPVVLHQSSGVGDDVGRVASPEIVTDETGTYLFYEKGDRLEATIALAKATTAAPAPSPSPSRTPSPTNPSPTPSPTNRSATPSPTNPSATPTPSPTNPSATPSPTNPSPTPSPSSSATTSRDQQSAVEELVRRWRKR